MFRRLGFSGLAAAILSVAILLGTGGNPAATGRRERPQVLFVHHSVGANLISQGDLRTRFAAAGYDLTDHGDNEYGLIGPNGKRVQPAWDIPDDNTDPDGLANLFAQPVHDPPDNAISQILTYDVIVVKSCYPVSDIVDDAQLDSRKNEYLHIRGVMDRHPDRLFVIVTPPPNVPGQTQPDRAARGRELASWLKSDGFLQGRHNIVVFDLFDALADDANYLRPEFRPSTYPMDFTQLSLWPESGRNLLRTVRAVVIGRTLRVNDSHPNRVANQTVAPSFVQAIVQAHQALSAPTSAMEIPGT